LCIKPFRSPRERRVELDKRRVISGIAGIAGVLLLFTTVVVAVGGIPKKYSLTCYNPMLDITYASPPGASFPPTGLTPFGVWVSSDGKSAYAQQSGELCIVDTVDGQ